MLSDIPTLLYEENEIFHKSEVKKFTKITPVTTNS